jgi:hypothetical protein
MKSVLPNGPGRSGRRGLIDPDRNHNQYQCPIEIVGIFWVGLHRSLAKDSGFEDVDSQYGATVTGDALNYRNVLFTKKRYKIRAASKPDYSEKNQKFVYVN